MLDCDSYHVGVKRLTTELLKIDITRTEEKPDPEYVLKGIETKLYELAKRYHIDVDELMLAGGYKRRPMSKDNVGLKILLETCRRKRNIIILVLPEIQDLDSAIKKRILHVFRIPDQGYVHFYGKRWSKQFVVDKKYNKLKIKKPMWRGRIRLATKILSTEAWDDYNKFRDDVQKVVRGLESPTDKRDARIVKLREKGLTNKEIGELEMLSAPRVQQIIGNWVSK